MSRGTASPAQWRFASRLARREVRRRPGRTALVVVLIAIPVMAMMIGSVLARTIGDKGQEFELRYGDDADVVATISMKGDVDWPANADGPLRAGSTVGDATVLNASRSINVPLFRDGQIVVDDRSTALVETVALRPDLSVTSGALPGDGEVWISRPLLDELGLDVGDTLSLDHPSGSWTIAATGENRMRLDANVIAGPDLALEQVRRSYRPYAELALDLPTTNGPVTDQAVRRMLDLDAGRMEWVTYHPSLENSADPGSSDVPASNLAWGWVAGAIALGVIGIIVSAAFATSARRQLITLGQLSSNGASPRLLTRTLALQGMWSGLLGSAIGVIAAVALLVSGRGFVEKLNAEVLADYRFAALDLVIIMATGTAAATLAALVPARSAAEVPTLAALAGRRPTGTIPRRLVPIGLGSFAVGLLLLAVAAAGSAGSAGGTNLLAATAVLGGLAVAGGMCCASPLAVDLMSRGASSVGGSWRFAGRSVARTRTRAAAVVTAVGITGAAALAGSTASASLLNAEEHRAVYDTPSGTVLVGETVRWPDDAIVIKRDRRWLDPGGKARTVDRPAPEGEIAPSVLRQRIAEVVPDATWIQRRQAAYDPAPVAFDGRGRATGSSHWREMQFPVLIADEALVDLYQLSEADRASLETYGALRLVDVHGRPARHRNPSPTIDVALPAEGGDITIEAGRGEWPWDADGSPRPGVTSPVVTGASGSVHLIITEEKARDLGLPIVDAGSIVRTPDPLTESQREAISFAVERAMNGDAPGTYYVDAPRPDPSDQRWWFAEFHWPSGDPVSETLIQGAIVGGALLLTLIVVAIGLALAATESRDETDVLIAVGAKPSTMRGMAGVKAIVLTLTGGVLAVPTGLIPMAVVIPSIGHDSLLASRGFVMPWVTVVGVVLVVPLIAGGAAWLTTAIARRVRRESMAQLAFE